MTREHLQEQVTALSDWDRELLMSYLVGVAPELVEQAIAAREEVRATAVVLATRRLGPATRGSQRPGVDVTPPSTQEDP